MSEEQKLVTPLGYTDIKTAANLGTKSEAWVEVGIESQGFNSRINIEELQELTTENLLDQVGNPVSSILEWDSTTNYDTIFTRVVRHGRVYTNINDTGNVDKDPFFNMGFWFSAGGFDTLRDAFFFGRTLLGGMHPANDRSSSLFRSNLDLGSYEYYGNTVSFYKISLNNQAVTGNNFLENTAFRIGQPDEYFYLDKYTYMDGATRRMIDKGDYVSAPQSSGGDADTLGELVEDNMQLHGHGTQLFDLNNTASGTGRIGNNIRTTTETTGDPVETTGGTPRTGSTTHGKRFTEGCAYIIVMVQV
jgi:hypothetical protein